MGHSAYWHLKNQEDHLQTLLDLLPTFPHPVSPCSEQHRLYHRHLDLDIIIHSFWHFAPMSRQVPSLGSSLFSYSVAADSPQIIRTPVPAGVPNPANSCPAAKSSSTLPHSHDLLSSVPIYCPAFLRTTPYTPNSTGAKSGSLEGDLFLIEEELVEKNRNSQQMLTGIPSAALALPRKCLSQL